MNPTQRREFIIVPFAPQYAQAFHDINLAWIDKYFDEVEEMDLKQLRNPQEAYIDPGGEIFFAVSEDVVAGCCAAKKFSDDRYELSKMGVDPAWQGYGLGRRLGQAVVDWFKVQGQGVLFIESNRKLTTAIELYRKLGFVERKSPIESPYCRCDIYLEWVG